MINDENFKTALNFVFESEVVFQIEKVTVVDELILELLKVHITIIEENGGCHIKM